MAKKPRAGMGAGGHCVCLGCGTRLPHRNGVRCLDVRCPQCGKAMLREGGEHHRKAIERQQGKNGD